MNSLFRTILPAGLLGLLACVFVGLGAWQVQRAEQKEALQREYDARSAAAPVALGKTIVQADDIKFRRVSVRGVYDPGYQIFIDNRIYRGVPGYHVVTPLKIENGGTRVLVNRGWVPMGASREHLPDAQAPPGVQQISGVAIVPAQNVFTLGADEPSAPGWRPVWQHLEMKRYAASAPFMLQPVVVLLDAAGPGGFTREWPRLDAGIAVHRGYAFQWFALAALAVIILGVMMRRAIGKQKKGRQ